MSVTLALAASVVWGISDFLGGLSSRRVALAAVLLISQSVGLLLLLPVASLHAAPPLELATLAYAMAGSLAGLIGIASLYRGMAIGTISIVAPISATGAAVPVVFGLLRGERASPLQSLGVLLALAGVVLASRSSGHLDASGGRSALARGVGFAVLAALGFGGFFVLLHEASARDVLWAGVLQRLTGVGVMLAIVLWRRISVRVDRARLPTLALVGALDTTANILYAYASVAGLVSLAAMLASLFPVVTVVLARVVLRERMSATQGTGVVVALAGVAFIAVQ
ncbi:MAG TPA: DMT family transporter [Chloroflexota bacterium]